MKNRLEKLLWNVRYVTLLAVILSIVSSIYLMILGSWEIIEAILFYNPLIDSSISENNELLFKMLGAGLLASDHQGPGCWRRNVLGTSHINIDIQHVPQDVSVSILHSACALPLLARFFHGFFPTLGPSF